MESLLSEEDGGHDEALELLMALRPRCSRLSQGRIARVVGLLKRQRDEFTLFNVDRFT